MPSRQKKDGNPVVLRLGVAFAISFAAFLCNRLRNKRGRLSFPASPPPSDGNEQAESGTITDQVHATATTPACPDSPLFSEPHSEFDDDSSNSSPSTSNTSNGDRFLLPEFSKLFQDIETPLLDEYEQEIKRLTSLVKDLSEQERLLEIQLLEYYGLKEQEMTVKELQTRLKINRIETRALSLKVESLEEENRRLAVRVADYMKVVDELEAAKTKIKEMESKLHKENKDQISRLLQRIEKVDLQETQGLEDLENELEELGKSKHELRKENSELGSRLDSMQTLANSMLEDLEVGELQNEACRLRKANETLVTEIDRLQSERCSDVVELVYLRWLNACLRYELRNHNPPQGQAVSSRDLSKSMSLKSEANHEERDVENGQRTLADAPVRRSKKLMVFDAIRRLLTGKANNDRNHICNKTATLVRSRSVQDVGKAYSILQRSNSLSTTPQSLNSTRSSLSSSCSCKSFVLGKEKLGTVLPPKSPLARGSEELCLGMPDLVGCGSTSKQSLLGPRRHKKSDYYAVL